jgi:hypothetical protein
MLAAAAGESVLAQTLTDPNSQPRSPRPTLTAKPPSSEHMKSCSIYGAGFVQVPGSDACIKIGGSVSVEGAAR